MPPLYFPNIKSSHQLFSFWFLCTVIQKALSCLEIDFDIWLLDTSQLCLIFISKGQFLLKKSSKATKAKKVNEGHQRPAKSKTSNSFVIITIQCKIINKYEYDTKKMCF